MLYTGTPSVEMKGNKGRITFFSAKRYDREYFNQCNAHFGYDLLYYETHLGPHIVNVVEDTSAVCVFVNDKLNEDVLRSLAEKGVKIIALRCAGYNNIDVEAANQLGLKVCRVPAYSPQAVAEHAAALILTLNRKTHKAYNRVREQNFSLDGLVGFNLYQKKIGVIGTGNIGRAFIRIMQGFGAEVLAYDLYPNKEAAASMGFRYCSLEEILAQSSIISLHCPLTEETHHIINQESIASMQKGVMLINTSRGGLIDTKAVIKGLKSHQIGYLGMDVYELEEKLFYRDLSANIIEDDTLQRLSSFPNVLITAHQAFFTNEALTQIAHTTLNSIHLLLSGETEKLEKGVLVS